MTNSTQTILSSHNAVPLAIITMQWGLDNYTCPAELREVYEQYCDEDTDEELRRQREEALQIRIREVQERLQQQQEKSEQYRPPGYPQNNES